MNGNRRDFMRAGSGVGGVLLLSSCEKEIGGTYQSLTEAEGTTLIALCEQIIPGDDYPGATDVGVILFIDRQLSEEGFYAKRRVDYQKGIADVNACCMALYNARFEALDFETQLRLLQRIEQGSAEAGNWKSREQKSFFKMLLTHTMQGFYGSPRHGGNKNYASFTMMGMDYPAEISQHRYKGLAHIRKKGLEGLMK